MGAQGRYCGAGQFKARHLNSGQRRDGHFGDVNVVEADDGEIVGHAQAGAVKLMQNADGGHVVRAHHGCRNRLRGEQALHGRYSALQGMVSFDDPCGVGGDAAFLLSDAEKAARRDCAE